MDKSEFGDAINGELTKPRQPWWVIESEERAIQVGTLQSLLTTECLICSCVVSKGPITEIGTNAINLPDFAIIIDL